MKYRRMNFRKWNEVFAAGALISALALCGCDSATRANNAAESANAQSPDYVAPDSKGVQTTVAKSSRIPEYLDLPGHVDVDPTRVVRVYPPAGGRITEMKVRPSDHVMKGQTLAILESSDLSRAVADYHKALADYEVKQKAFDRAEDLFAHHAIAEKDYQQAQADAKMSDEELAATKEQIRVLGMDPDHAATQLHVDAPRAGVVLDVGAASGEFSNALSAPAPLATVADITEVWAIGDIYEKDLVAAKKGGPAQVTMNAYPGKTWQGTVGVVSDAVDPNTHTLHVRVILPNPGELLKPAMFGSIRLLRSSRQGILVPASAVIREGNDAYIFVGKGNNRFDRRSVTLGRTFDGSIEIVKGLNDGDTVVSEGALLLREAAGD
jgi:cobalt-zinc-cadmium efflux system membrane fusion protein